MTKACLAVELLQALANLDATVLSWFGCPFPR